MQNLFCRLSRLVTAWGTRRGMSAVDGFVDQGQQPDLFIIVLIQVKTQAVFGMPVLFRETVKPGFIASGQYHGPGLLDPDDPGRYPQTVFFFLMNPGEHALFSLTGAAGPVQIERAVVCLGIVAPDVCGEFTHQFFVLFFEHKGSCRLFGNHNDSFQLGREEEQRRGPA